MAKIYTKTGDKGQTSYLGGRISKSDNLIEAIGNLDELNAEFGLVLSSSHLDHEIANKLIRTQHQLFAAGAVLADHKAKFRQNYDFISWTKKLEEEIDSWTKVLPELAQFILPGGSPAGSRIHKIRTDCRRVERSIVRLQSQDDRVTALQIFLNRLSDWLFTLARYINYTDEIPEIVWEK